VKGVLLVDALKTRVVARNDDHPDYTVEVDYSVMGTTFGRKIYIAKTAARVLFRPHSHPTHHWYSLLTGAARVALRTGPDAITIVPLAPGFKYFVPGPIPDRLEMRNAVSEVFFNARELSGPKVEGRTIVDEAADYFATAEHSRVKDPEPLDVAIQP
jgi:hypothetical protein